MALAPAGFVYGAVAGRRMFARPKFRSRLPVICIGNFVVGGTGKTPFALRLAELLVGEGLRPGFLLRGYGGSEQGPICVDPDVHGADQAGDEALLLAALAPTVVSADRPAGARLAEELPIDVIVMDDGFQNPSLAKDLSIVLVDCKTGLGNGLCLPAGPLRAPANRQMGKADVLMLIGAGQAGNDAVKLAGRRAMPILHSKLVPIANPALSDVDCFAFAGIGRPQKFFDTLTGLGFNVVKTKGFADHHKYSEQDVKTLLSGAEAEHLQLVTTAKDMARLSTANSEIYRWLVAKTEVLDVEMAVEDEDRLMNIVKDRLRSRTFKTGG